jgi:hypothetical protein
MNLFHMKETNQTTRDTVIQQPTTLPPQDSGCFSLLGMVAGADDFNSADGVAI